MRELVLDLLAEDDLKEAASRYEAEVSGLGADLTDEVYAVGERLVAVPESGSLKTKNVRVARGRRFPYDVFYTFEASRDIFVLAISLQHRRPGLWKKLTSGRRPNSRSELSRTGVFARDQSSLATALNWRTEGSQA